MRTDPNKACEKLNEYSTCRRIGKNLFSFRWRSMMEISSVDPVKDHAAQRLREYPSVGDQLDADAPQMSSETFFSIRSRAD